jgi:hypothetical protein
MGVEKGAASREKIVLADLPVPSVRIGGHHSTDDLQRDRETLNIMLRGDMMEREKVLLAEDHNNPVGSDGVEVRESDGLPDSYSFFRDNFFWKPRGFQKNIPRAEDTSFGFPRHLGKIEFISDRKAPGNDPASALGERIDPNLGGNGNSLKPPQGGEEIRLEMKALKFNFHALEIPISKFQIPNNFQVPNSNDRNALV